MLRNALPSLLLLLAPAALESVARAQAPKPGTYFEDVYQVGFKVKAPKDWDIVPGRPDEGNVIAKFKDPKVPYVIIGGDVLFKRAFLLKFDRREGNENADDMQPDLEQWVASNREIGSGFALVESKPTRIGKLECLELKYEGRHSPTSQGPGAKVYFWGTQFAMSPDVDLVYGFITPAGKYFKKWERPLRSLVRTLKPLELEVVEAPTGPSGTLRAQKRIRLQNEVRGLKGWELFETPNYFVVTNNDDTGFLDELMERLEDIRAVYEVDYPVERVLTARRAREAREAAQKEAAEKEKAKQDPDGAPEGDAEGQDGDDAEPERTTVAQRADPMELSRCSVVRVCASREEYMSYGGPGGSAGYWSSGHEELVVYDDKGRGGRNNTWVTLNHEAFHQYIYYFYGNLAPHSWYNEGTGDYYSGYQPDNRGRYSLEPNPWRHRYAQQLLSQEKNPPLEEFVRYTQRKYYEKGQENYCLGWAFIYFLRTGKERRARGWNDDWNSILEVYLDTLAETGDLDAAVDKAYAGVDYAELEAAWRHYIVEQS